MKSAEERTVGPTLGEAAINRGKLAFVIGITLVIVFMLIYYKLSGVIAVIALLFNFQIILAILAGLGATLTLPGMAGLILTVGMSVDANVLILERIREAARIDVFFKHMYGRSTNQRSKYPITHISFIYPFYQRIA